MNKAERNKASDFVNWREVSRALANNDGSIRSNRMPDKYVERVDDLLGLVTDWVKAQGDGIRVRKVVLPEYLLREIGFAKGEDLIGGGIRFTHTRGANMIDIIQVEKYNDYKVYLYTNGSVGELVLVNPNLNELHELLESSQYRTQPQN